jgi:regulator of cell morphogenesis and NO signaling
MNTHDIQSLSVAEIVNQNPGTIKVFEMYGIDYCCNGKQSFSQACERADVTTDEVMRALSKTLANTFPAAIRVQSWSGAFLADYIEQNHHSYVRQLIPEIEGLTNKVASVHGGSHSELRDIHNYFQELADELLAHMEKEENILFPAIRAWEKSGAAGINVQYPIQVMEHEHEAAGSLLKKIREATSQYKLPAEACNSYRLMFQRLQEFEADLHIHIHLENNILFPRAIQKMEEVAALGKCKLPDEAHCKND